MKTPLKVKTSRETARRSNSPFKETTKKDKGKGKAKADVEIVKPGSQLKAGWMLQPLDLSLSISSSNKKKQSATVVVACQLPGSASKKRVKSSSETPASVKKPKKNICALEPITILTDSDGDDDDIQEIACIPVASTSAVKLKSRPPKQETSVHKPVPKKLDVPHPPPLLQFDLDDEDGGELEEDESFVRPPSPIVFEDDEILVNDDEWEDSERIVMRRTAGSREASEFEESMFGDDMMMQEDDSQMYEDYQEERGAGSDDDILELMDRNEGSESANKKSTSSGANKNLLRPLSSLRRSISPLASTSLVTLDTRPNAFTAIMQGNSIDKQWAEAAESEKAQAKRGFVRPAPFYKILDGMTIAVDAFKYGKIPGVEAYFLSHAHSDHYTNLSSSWANGPIYCSVGTANLIRYKLGVKDEWLHPLPFDQPFDIAGCKVTLIDANHCPGSSIFVFEGPHTSPSGAFHKKPSKIFRYLHCGDFRASPAHLLHPAIKGKKFDICYLDTTYLNPKYCFPAQEQVVEACAELIRARVEGDRDALKKGSGGGAQLVRQGEMMKGWLNKAKKEELEEAELNGSLLLDEEDEKKKVLVKAEGPKERLLVMVGTYSIGKERIVKGIARAINAKIYCDKRKKEIFECQDDPELMSMVTEDPLEGQIHVTWLGQIKVDELSDYLDKYKPHFSHIVGLRPTGWTFKPEGNMALTLKNPSVIQMISRELQRKYNPSWMTPTKDSTRVVEAYGVPYSEHSSFAELTCFAVSFDCAKFIPTVNVGSKPSRQKMQVWIDKWIAERKRRQAAGETLMVPHRTMNYW